MSLLEIKNLNVRFGDATGRAGRRRPQPVGG
jgi:hypothetical protein